MEVMRRSTRLAFRSKGVRLCGSDSATRPFRGSPVVLACTGQGSQHIGMGNSLFLQDERAKHTLDLADTELGWSLSKLMENGPIEKLNRTENAQLAQFVVSVAAFNAFRHAYPQVQHNLVMGHSLGELTAMYLSGVLNELDLGGATLEHDRAFGGAIHSVRLRGEFMQKASDLLYGGSSHTHKMAAIMPLNKVAAQACCEAARDEFKHLEALNICDVANINSPKQVVISGTAAVVDFACEIAKRQYKARRAVALPVSAPFHSQAMAAAEEQWFQALNASSLNEVPTSRPLLTNKTNVKAKVSVRDHTIRGCIDWCRALDNAIAFCGEPPVFIELGGKTLTPLIKAYAGKKIAGAFPLATIEDLHALEAEICNECQ
mmetsp:Transcript_2443/g.4725  ORF Transcript_2443/g.4725 Transcript_2443/m.4725 type:complete len:375 (+) Transcript_2443:393-1517(+)